MIGQSISEMIQNGFNRNIVIYDNEAEGFSLRLFGIMACVGRRNNIRITQFIIPEDSRSDLLEIFQENPLLFGPPFNFTEENLTDYKIIGRDLLIVNGLSEYDTNPKYFKYYKETLRAVSLTFQKGLVLGLDKNFNCLLGAC